MLGSPVGHCRSGRESCVEAGGDSSIWVDWRRVGVDRRRGRGLRRAGHRRRRGASAERLGLCLRTLCRSRVIMFVVVRAIGVALGATVGSLAVQVVAGDLVYGAHCSCWMARTGDELYAQVIRPASRGLLGRLRAKGISNR